MLIVNKKMKKSLENMKALEIQTPFKKKFFNFTMIGKTLQHTNLLYGLMNGTQEMPKIVT